MLVLPQELTHAQAAACLSMLTAALKSQAGQHVPVDCSALERFDSSALAVLLGANRVALKAGQRLQLRSCPERLQQLAEVYGVLEVFELIGSSAAQAVAEHKAECPAAQLVSVPLNRLPPAKRKAGKGKFQR